MPNPKQPKKKIVACGIVSLTTGKLLDIGCYGIHGKMKPGKGVILVEVEISYQLPKRNKIK